MTLVCNYEIKGLDRYLSEDCAVCSGTGVLRSRATLCFDILREIRRESNRKKDAAAVYVNTTPEIADMLYGPRFTDLESAEESLGRRIVVRALGHYHPEQYEVYAK